MKIGKIKVAPLICILWMFLGGFVLGVISISLWQDNWFVKKELLNQDFINNIMNINIDKRALFFLCLGKKARAFFVLFLLSFSTLNLWIVFGYFGFLGYACGSVLELLMIRYGIKGSLLYFSFVFPQGIFYFLGYLILGCWCLSMENEEKLQRKKKIKKIVQKNSKTRVYISFGLILLGAWLESILSLKIFFLFFDV